MEGYVDTSRAERAVWLMKCPAVVSRSLHSINDNNNLPVAKVVVSIDPLRSNDNDSTQAFIRLNPGVYLVHVDIDDCFLTLKFFLRADILYVPQVIGTEKPIIPMPGITHVQERRKQVVKASEPKRTRRDREEMEEIMFKLFEQQPNWTLKELIHKTDQPEQFMKDLLKELCVYSNKGAKQGNYELKPEYKKSIQEPSGSWDDSSRRSS
ncbi:hypothetical protein Cgig2_023886 [Carnegiea gigantea]|uniref:TFIIF beta subunit HTH domain-containing protein n=1 Tax=Carnegiea gigantea TaxID=171969 RepID=A0A9Q1GJ71_9CARY|nr:hypothetical protein Cgig2_023886 [Carnegiea gigantea]